jgi:TPR repeat protein
LLVRGLALGAKLSVGQPSDVDGWELSVEDLGGAVIIPPAGFVGTMDLTLSLRRGAATSDRQSLQVEWAGGTAAALVPTARLEPSDVARLLQRGEELLANREIAAARAVFKRLADNGEPRGAFALAETYEQSTLERLGAKGILPDMAAARTWYETAKALGSTEAQHHLDLPARSQ